MKQRSPPARWRWHDGFIPEGTQTHKIWFGYHAVLLASSKPTVKGLIVLEAASECGCSPFLGEHTALMIAATLEIGTSARM